MKISNIKTGNKLSIKNIRDLKSGDTFYIMDLLFEITECILYKKVKIDETLIRFDYFRKREMEDGCYVKCLFTNPDVMNCVALKENGRYISVNKDILEKIKQEQK